MPEITREKNFPWLPPSRIAFWLYLLLLSAWLAHLATCLGSRFGYLPDSVDSQMAILNQRPFVFAGEEIDYPVWRQRVIIPLIIKGIATVTPLTISQAYILTRMGTAFLALAAFAFLIKRHLRAEGWFVALGVSILVLSIGPTFLHIYDIPSDFLDAAAMAGLTLLALERRYTAFTILLFTALFNREGAIFAIVLWGGLHAWPVRGYNAIRNLVFCGIVGTIGAIVVIGLRHLNAVTAIHTADMPIQPFIPWKVHIMQLTQGLTHPHPGNAVFFLLGYIGLFTLVLKSGWGNLQANERRLGIVAISIALFSALFGNLVELRTQMAAIVWLTFLALVIAHRHLAKQMNAPLSGKTI